MVSMLRREPGLSRPATVRVPAQRSGGGAAATLASPIQVDAVPIAVPAPRINRTAHALPREPFLILAADVLVVVPLAALGNSLLWPIAFAVAALTWRLRGLYTRRIALSVLDDLPALSAGVLIALAPVTMLGLVVSASTGSMVALAAAMLVGVVLARMTAYATILRLRATGRISYPTLMVGAGPVAASLAQRVQAHPESGLRLVGTMGEAVPGRTSPLPLLGEVKDLACVVRDREITDVLVGHGGLSSVDLVDVLRTCDRMDVEIFVVPRLFEMHRLRSGDDHIWGVPLVRVRRSAHRVATWRLKRLLDLTLAGSALILLAPLMLATAAAVRLEMGPGVIFKQIRVGLDGRPFEVKKFRSMRSLPPGAQSEWTVTAPDRVGKIGRFIRRYSIDELPQLLNVMRGDMSIVGPRPERPEYVEQFSAMVPRYGHRHRVPVGLTGLAAVNGLRGDTSIEDRAHFDNWYIENWSLWFDIKIIARTALAVVRGTGS